MNKSINERYKLARNHFKLSQKAIAKKLGVKDGLINSLETGRTNNPNFEYTKGLIELGINPYFLIGASDEIEGQLVDAISRKEYEFLASENENLKAELENLKQEMKETVSRSEFEEVTHKLEAYAEIIRMLKNEKS